MSAPNTLREALAQYIAAREAWRHAEGSQEWARTERAMFRAANHVAELLEAVADLESGIAPLDEGDEGTCKVCGKSLPTGEPSAIDGVDGGEMCLACADRALAPDGDELGNLALHNVENGAQP